MSRALTVYDEPPEQRRRNLILGGVLLAWVLAVVAIFVWRFTVAGLPPDKDMVEEMQRRGVPVEGVSDE